ncbi:hypothetical protein PTSG_07782 [Salpingoeca rosetta]|uniref:Histone acetyltransferase type B catalytic subunit n=1 Tax=Salpingoeca rosetta (strain ATCC 50818 / BSB-021) TaxID=946362 RepID=F2UGB3_SALR5|nr:uncharacterized protein PTSG_07782 [Salpingoeca rosetta]EGD75663.1 hypothetical protein PTSG_07782 [Salpingoeca rosetta]|eukprot:XP_004991584.1 hypothetical protein PTSG_07782 [Salpingoeca rosetta]
MENQEKRAKLTAVDAADDDDGAVEVKQQERGAAKAAKARGVKFQLDEEQEAREIEKQRRAAIQKQYQEASATEDEEQLGPWLSWADQAINVTLVSSSKTLSKDVEVAAYHPEFTHQVIGETEKIYGYEDLQVEVMYSAGALSSYVGIDYEDRVDNEDKDAEPDNVIKSIIDWMPPTCTTDRSKFLQQCDADRKAFKPVGDVVFEGKGKQDETLQVYLASADTSGFVDYHSRAQTLAVWSIEQATWLDLTDTNWRVFYLFKKDTTDDGDVYSLLGFSTVYRYYVFPDKIRPRISQHLVLPPHQRRGYGTVLYEAVAAHLRTLDDVVDITVEAPVPAFEVIRDKIDCKECLKLPFVADFDFDTTGPQPFVDHVREKLKLSKKQGRHVYELLHFLAVVNGKASEETFLQRLKARLYRPHHHELAVKNKLRSKLSEQEQRLIDQQQQALKLTIEDQSKAVCRDYAARLQPKE